MKELKTTLQKGTKTFRQIEQSPKAYIYEITDIETQHVYYEVFYRKETKAIILPSGKMLPNRIAYPSNSDFGITAWCISKGSDQKLALKCALYRFNFLNECKKVA